MPLINGGLINVDKGGSQSNNSQLALSDGLACYTQDFSGVSTTQISHGLDSTDLIVEFKDSAGSLLIPDTWSIINRNVIEVEFTPSATGDVTIVACIESGLAPITGGVTLLEGLSGIIDLDSPNGSIDISTSGQVINLNAIFTPASGALLEQKCEDIDTLSGLIGTPATTSGQAFYYYDGGSGFDYTFETEFSPMPLNQMVVEDSDYYTVTSGDLALRFEQAGLYKVQYDYNVIKVTRNTNTKIEGRVVLNGDTVVSGTTAVGYLQNRNNANTESLTKEFKVQVAENDLMFFQLARVTGNGELTFMDQSSVSVEFIRS